MPEVSDIAKDLMLHLIATPERRLGRSGIQDFVNHPFFDGISWDTIREGTTLAVFVALSQLIKVYASPLMVVK